MSYQDHVRRQFWDRDNWVVLDTKLNFVLVMYAPSRYGSGGSSHFPRVAG